MLMLIIVYYSGGLLYLYTYNSNYHYPCGHGCTRTGIKHTSYTLGSEILGIDMPDCDVVARVWVWRFA